MLKLGLPGASDDNESARNMGDLTSIPVSGRSPGDGNGKLLQYPCLENSMDRGAWQVTVYGVTKRDMTERLTQQQMLKLFRKRREDK